MRDWRVLFSSNIFAVTEVNRGSTFAPRRSTLDFCLGGQRSLNRFRCDRSSDTSAVVSETSFSHGLSLQGYLAQKKTQPHRTLQWAYA